MNNWDEILTQGKSIYVFDILILMKFDEIINVYIILIYNAFGFIKFACFS